MAVQIVEEGFIALSELTGLDEASLKILTCAFLSFPFSIIFKRLPDKKYTLKHSYIVGVAAFYVFVILSLGSGFFTLLFSSLGTYAITRYVKTSSMPWINFLFLMGHLATSHLKAQFFNSYDATKIDITGAQMVMVMKLSAFGWSVYDAKQPAESLTEYTKYRAIKRHPNILEYFGYVFFYPSLLTGPAFDFVDYDKFIHSHLFDDVPEDRRPGRKTPRRIPRSGRQALWKVLQGLFWAGLFIEMPKYFNLKYVLGGAFYVEHGFIYRIFYLWILGIVHRLKYYTIWLIAEGSCILCGIGYNGYDPVTKKFKWNRVQNIDPWVFETGQNCHVCLEAWNMNTNKWLKHFVYLRIAKKGRRPGFKSTLFTFATSAFWHGTRPGYYLTFVLGAFLQTAGKLYRRNLRPIFLEKDGKTPKSTKPIYDFVCYIVTQLAFGFVCQPFVILDFKASLYCWATVYFYVPVVTLFTLFLFKGPYSKKVVAFFRKFNDSYQEQQRIEREAKLTNEEADKVHSLIDKRLQEDSNASLPPALGAPPIDVLENLSKEELEAEMKELKETWNSFRGRKGSFSNDFDGFKNAYKNFTDEINQIIHEKTTDDKKTE